MQFLNFLLPPEMWRSQDQTLVNSGLFVELSSRMLAIPIQATIDVGDGCSPLVKFAGTFWRFKLCGLLPSTFVDGQPVKILGIQGNCLLIEMEACDGK
jgi:hypothetical protein